jgi:hypothetical protein
MLLTLLKGGGGGLPPTPIIGVRTETEAVSEAVSRLLAIVRVKGGDDSSDEDVAVSEAVSRVLSIVRSVSETESVSEAVSRLMSVVRTVSDTESIADAVLKVIGAIRSVSDTESITDAVQRILGQIRSVSDLEKIDEGLVSVRALVRIINEDLLVGTSKGDADDTTSLALRKTLGDFEYIADNLATTFAFRRALGDTEYIGEAVSRILCKIVNDSVISIIENRNYVAGFVRIINEGFGGTTGRSAYLRRR